MTHRWRFAADIPLDRACEIIEARTGLTRDRVLTALGADFSVTLSFSDPGNRAGLQDRLRHTRDARKRVGKLVDHFAGVPFVQEEIAHLNALAGLLETKDRHLSSTLRMKEANATKRRVHIVADAVLRSFVAADLRLSAATGSAFVQTIAEVYRALFRDELDARHAARGAIDRWRK